MSFVFETPKPYVVKRNGKLELHSWEEIKGDPFCRIQKVIKVIK